MGNGCESKKRLSWVEGNDVMLAIDVKELTEDGEQAVDLDACDEIRVTVHRVLDVQYVAAEYAIGSDVTGRLVVQLPSSLKNGSYELEVVLVVNGYQSRSFDLRFDVARCDSEANWTGEGGVKARSATLVVTVVPIIQALVRGKNAYELWKDLPGNENKPLQEYIDTVLDMHGVMARLTEAEQNREQAEQNREQATATALQTVTAATSAANAAAAAATDKAQIAEQKATEAGHVNASLNGTELTVVDRNGNSVTQDVQGPKGEPGDKGDPGTTDYNDLTNKPDLSKKQDVLTADGIIRINKEAGTDGRNFILILGNRGSLITSVVESTDVGGWERAGDQGIPTVELVRVKLDGKANSADLSKKQDVLTALEPLSIYPEMRDELTTYISLVTTSGVVVTAIIPVNDEEGWDHAGDGGIPTVGLVKFHVDRVEAALAGKEGSTAIVAPVNSTDATLPVTSLACEVGKYYRIDVPVETLAVTLPAMSNVTTVKTVVLYLTAGTTPAVTISAADGKEVLYQDGFEIEAGKTYEINALYNGAVWVVASVEIIVE